MDKQQLRELANFNKLNLSPAEDEQMTAYLDYALAALKQIQEQPTAGVKPLVHCLELTNIFREDEACQPVSRQQILANAPQQQDGCFQVPKVVE